MDVQVDIGVANCIRFIHKTIECVNLFQYILKISIEVIAQGRENFFAKQFGGGSSGYIREDE